MIKYLTILTLILSIFNGCSNRDYGDQDISKIPNTLSTKSVSILSTIPSKDIAQSSYILVEFSSFMDFKSFSSSEVVLINSATGSKIEIEIDGNDNHLYIKPLQSLVPGEKYLLTINSNAIDIMGNKIDRGYERTFTCREDFWKRVEVGETHSMALSRDGNIYVWGSNSDRELKLKSDFTRSIPVGIFDSNGSKDFNAGSFTSGIIAFDGTLSIFGKQSLDETNNKIFSKISIGNRHSAVILNDGTLWSWGENINGQLGNSGIIERVELTQEDTNSTEWSSVSAGINFTIALKKDGTMWGWGTNKYGQIGNSIYNERRRPVQEDTHATDWIALSAGRNHSVAIKQNGSIWSWGDNTHGTLGDSTNISSRVPVQEATHSKWKSVSAGNLHTVAIKNDGTLWSWGDNYYGQLGDNSIIDKNTPTQIGSDTWSSVSCGTNFTIATKENGTMWAWGYNAQKQLGLGDDAQDELVPTEIK